MATIEFRQGLSPKRILVVEDEKVAALSIRTILAADGHAVQIAEDAEQALVALQSFQFDLVLTDFQLPGMDGLELAALIKQQLPEVPIILITAFAEKIGGMGKVSNIDLVMSKPFSVVELQRALQNAFATAES